MRRAGWVVGVALAATVAVDVLAASKAARADGSPIVPPGAWRAVWLVGVCAAFALYGLGILLARRTPLVAAVAVAVVVQSTPLLGPLLLSRDVYLYWSEARVVTVHHANPYTTTPSRYPADPSTRAASAQWRTETAPYGPGWVVLSAPAAAAAGTDKSAADVLYRALALLGILLTIAVLALRTRSARAVAFFGWSPLLAFHFAGGGHTDSWIALALVVGVTCSGTVAGGLAWPLGASIKGIPAVVLPLELARHRFRFPRRFWLTLVGASAVIVIAATAAFGPHWITASLIGAHGTSPIGGVHFLTEAGLRHRYAVLVGALVFLCVYAVLLREAWSRGRARLALAVAALCMCSSLLRPWYAIWPVALAAVEADGPGELAAFALSAYVLFADAVSF